MIRMFLNIQYSALLSDSHSSSVDEYPLTEDSEKRSLLSGGCSVGNLP